MAGDPHVSVVREIADGATVSPEATIGPVCTIGPEVVIGAGTELGPRVTVVGRTKLGADNVVGDGCVLGAIPQDLKYLGKTTWLIIGDRNHIGPDVTAHTGTEPGGYLTRIGHDNVLDTGVHIAHDCYIDDHTHLRACVLLAGHVHVETGAVIEENCGAHHFTTVGRFSRVGSRTPVRRDVPPFAFFTSFGLYTAPPAPRGADEAGMQRAGLSDPDKAELREAVRHLFEDEQALAVKVEELLAREPLRDPVRELCEFCRRSLSGTFGRQREVYRGQLPPEARKHLPPEALARIDRKT